jgi:CxxC-x17-CxxC domain-containing protein
MYTDETLTCVDCNAPFTFSTGEQEFFAAKGFNNKPSRCVDCRAARKTQRGAGGGSSYGSGGGGSSSVRAPREMFEVKCSQCGGLASVPFQPRGDKPVYCRECFQARGSGGGSYR